MRHGLGIDAADNLMMLTAVLRLRGSVDWSRFADVVQQRMVARYPPFRQRALRAAGPLGHSVCSDDPDFDLTAHVVPGALVADSESGLADLVSKLLETPLDMTRSPWQFHLVDGPMGCSTIVARLHHCIAAGIALASVLLSLTDSTEDTPMADVTGASSSLRATRAPGCTRGWAPGRARRGRGRSSSTGSRTSVAPSASP